MRPLLLVLLIAAPLGAQEHRTTELVPSEVRAQPTEHAEVVRVFRSKVQLKVVACANGWCEVTWFEPGSHGYVAEAAFRDPVAVVSAAPLLASLVQAPQAGFPASRWATRPEYLMVDTLEGASAATALNPADRVDVFGCVGSWCAARRIGTAPGWIRADALTEDRAYARAAGDSLRLAQEDARRTDLFSRGWPAVAVEAILDRRVVQGMTADMVRHAWGPPTSVNRTVVLGETREQWVYARSGGRDDYVYLQSGVVTALQTSR